MTEPLSLLVGPLVVPECRRSLARGWLIAVRVLAALALTLVLICVIWWWWSAQQLDPFYRPYTALRSGLAAYTWLSIGLALVMTPAVLAGSLAGEKERGSMALLLTTRVSPREIVAGRVTGKLSQILMSMIAGLPAFAMLACLSGLRIEAILTLLAMPLCAAFGAAGLSAAASSLSKRGRDALLTVYMILFLILVSRGLAELLPPAWGWIARISPYYGMSDAVWGEAAAPVLPTLAIWTGLGIVGITVASFRLRPACMSLLGGDVKSKRGRRNMWVPAVGERPMLWKELHIERAGALGKAGTFLGILLIAWLALGSIGLAVGIAWYTYVAGDISAADGLRVMIGEWYGDTAGMLSVLVQAAVALRAAVAIASERERNTWDGLLTSPLEGKDIVRGKLWGSLYGLRHLFGATILAWTIAMLCGGMRPLDYIQNLLLTLIISCFSAAIGVRISLEAGTATKAMTISVVTWIVCLGIFALIAAAAGGIVVIGVAMVWEEGLAYGLWLTPLPPTLIPWLFIGVFWPVFLALYVLATAIILLDSRLRFDRIAGRMTGGEAAAAVDRFIHGTPMAPVALRPDAELRPATKASGSAELPEPVPSRN